MSSTLHVLNIAALDGRSGARRPPGALALELQKTMLKLKGQYMSENGSEVHYGKLKGSQLFTEYEAVAGQLCHCDLNELQDEEEKKAFFISILSIIVNFSACIYLNPYNRRV